jgi:hypothetical protein
LVRSVNNILKKNRRIIEEQIFKTGAETAKASRSKLLELGFNFKYYTNTYTTKKETVYYFCYEYGYLPIEGDWIFMVKRKEE